MIAKYICKTTDHIARFVMLQLYVCFRLNFLLHSCYNAVLIVWLGLRMKVPLLWLGKHQGLA